MILFIISFLITVLVCIIAYMYNSILIGIIGIILAFITSIIGDDVVERYSKR